MIAPKIEKIIVKYLTKSATKSDLDKLSEWIEEPSNKIFFKNYVQTHYAIIFNTNNPSPKKTIEQLIRKIRKEKSLVYRLKKQSIFKYTAAAIIIGVLASTYFFRENIFTKPSVETTPKMVDINIIKPGSDKATLTLEDGSIIVLQKGNSYQTKSISSNGKRIIYETDKKNSKEIAYNYLTIPRGGQFHLVLSDQTQIWLNSESQLKYPVNFIKGETRKVELVYGEAYFDVSPSEKHSKSKFVVSNKHQDIEVLGTEFNIKAYRDETNIYTTLVEGKVSISSSHINKVLKPTEQANFNFNENTIMVNKVNVYNEISWKDGVFSFKGKPLKDIMKVLSRWYDVTIIFEDKSLESIKFKGTLEKTQTIEEILLIMKSSSISDYTIKDKTITLK